MQEKQHDIQIPKMINYLKLTNDQKHILVLKLHSVREQLKKEAKAKKIRKKGKGRKRKAITFKSDALNKIFHEMPKELHDYFSGR